MRKALLLVAVLLLAINVAYPQAQRPQAQHPQAQPQAQRAESQRQINAGEVVPFGENLFVKVARSTKPFEGVKAKGEAMVVALEMDSGKQGATLYYKLSADPTATEVYLMSGAKKWAPRAVIEDFPSWGDDNDKEVEVLDPKDKIGAVTLTFEKKGAVLLLFDVPPEDAKTPKKLSVVLRMVQPKDEQRSFVVTL